MAGGSSQDAKEGDPAPARRTRAPTITIDTTAVGPSPAAGVEPEGASEAVSNSPVSLGGSTDVATDSRQRSLSETKPDVPATKPADNRDSRPTSPHNVSNPFAFRGTGPSQGFLAVPSTQRSRQNSVNSADDSRSIASSQGDTVVAGSSVGEKAGPSLGEQSEYDRIVNDPDALKPDQGKEGDFEVEDNPFAFSPGMLSKMFDPKSLSAFWKLGGLAGIEKGLRSNRTTGLSVDETSLAGSVSFEEATSRASDKAKAEGGTPTSQTDGSTAHSTRHDPPDEPFSSRKRVFRDNRLPEKKGKSLLQLMWITYNDKVLILLSIAAVVSLAVGLYQTFDEDDDPEDYDLEWIEGVAIIVAIVIVVLVGSLNDFQKERQFAKLNRKKQDRLVRAIRSGKTVEISVFDILVGDVLHLEPGDMIPVDGILIEGFNVKCDESQATGESDIIRKKPADEVYAAIENRENPKKLDPFIQSGSRVMEGVGTFMVTSTGVHSSYGKTMMALHEDPEITPLQSKLNVIAEYIAKLGGAVALLFFLVLFIIFLVRLPRQYKDLTPAAKGQHFIELFIVVVTIVVVAIPEGLPLAVTLALAFATTRMIKDNNLVRHLKACEVMGNATTICSDKTGTLTQNKMQVVAGTIGTAHRFGTTTPPDERDTVEKEVGVQELVKTLSPEVKDLVRKSIALNSTAFESDGGEQTFIGSKTETALLILAREHLAMGPVSEERANAKMLHLIPFDSGRKCMGVVVQLDNGKARLYVKGASEIMLEKCTQVLRDPSSGLASATLTEDNRETIKKLIETYAKNSLRTIGLIYRDFDRWPPRPSRRIEVERDEIVFEDICRNMVFVGMVGIKDPLRPGVPEAVRLCQKAGVVVRMVTGDNKITAEAIARDCGILQPNSIVLEGPEFRNMSKAQQDEIIPRLHVLARSSPEDKRILVKRLKDKGETVAVTGDGTNDAPALKMADIGFSMGIAGTEVAKEASAIILMDDNFNSIVKALKWGRAVNDAVKRFLQFQLTVNVTAVVLTFVSAVQSASQTAVLTAVQLLWVNLIMDTLAALALATDPPQDSVLDRKPERKGSSIISTTMWKMILGQAVYQLLITFLVYFGGVDVLPGPDDMTESQIHTLVFNTFVWMQIFNQWNNRRLDNNFNIFEGMQRNPYFLGISAIMCGGQVLIVMVGGPAFRIAPEGQTALMWGIAIVLGALSIPVGVIIRLIPDELLESLIPAAWKRKTNTKVPGVTVSDEEQFASYPAALADVRDELAWLKRVKGGRLNNLKFAMQHPRETFLPRKTPSQSRQHSRSNSSQRLPQTPTREDSYSSIAPTPDSRRRSRSTRSRSNSALGAATVMTGIVAGSIGAGWSPIDRRGEPDFGQFPRPSLSGQEPRAGETQPPASQSALGEQAPLPDEPQEVGEAVAPATQDVPILSVPRPPKSSPSTPAP